MGGRGGEDTEKRVGFWPGPVFVPVVANAWTEHPIFFVDFEGGAASGILEFGVACVQGGRIGETHTGLCAATGPIRPEDSAVHGLTAAAVEGRTPFAAEWERFAGFRETGPLAAHFAGVENGLLKSVWPYPRNSPDFARPGARVIEWGPWVDTARLYGQLYPSLPSARLEELVGACGLQARLEAAAAISCPPGRRHYHAALYDALAGALLLARLAEEPAVAGLSIRQLLALSTLDPVRRDTLRQDELF